MCGIAAVIPAQGSEALLSGIDTMVSTLSHRGPDAQASYSFTRAALGQTRLSIVDLVTGDQPMFNHDRTVAVVFNGELYGYEALKRSLDYPFRTSSDTEVLLALYQRYGEDMVRHVPGMFAFALWDDKTQMLLVARDRFGEKPLYYATLTDGSLILGSEIRALLSTGELKTSLRRDALTHYLKYLYVPPTATIYNEIRVLPPGSQLTLRQGKLSVRSYWQLPTHIDRDMTLEDAAEELAMRLDRAVQQQLVADVPVGSFLSGGLDSSTIVALAKKHKPGLLTLSFGFEGIKSELAFARAVAQQHQTKHIELEEKELQIGELFETMNQVFDEPFADSSNIPTYVLCQLARKHVTVALSGDGGDELLGGYGWYRPLYDLTLWSRYPDWMMRSIQLVLQMLSLAWKQKSLGYLQKSVLARQQGLTLDALYRSGRTYFSAAELTTLGWHDLAGQFEPTQPLDSLDSVMRWDVTDYLPGDILTKTDRASMAHGLELRSPFLDVQVATHLLSLPYQVKVSTWSDKLLLRQAFEHTWPDMVRKRRKQGFGAPVTHWLKRRDMTKLKQRYLAKKSRSLFDLMDYSAVQDIAKQNTYQTWILLVLSLWLETHEW